MDKQEYMLFTLREEKSVIKRVFYIQIYSVQ